MFDYLYDKNTATLAKKIIFIDSQVENYQCLAAGVKSDIETVILHGDLDGIEQITSVLDRRSKISEVHIVAHGSPGCLKLGNTQLSLETLARYQANLQHWLGCSSLLIYGCNVAAGVGREFITKLRQITRACVWASTTPVGNSSKGGNWVLDVCHGETHRSPSLAFTSQTLASYSGVLVTGSDGNYTYYDSKEPSKGQVEFINISSTGTDVRVNDRAQQDWQETIKLPFSFKFYAEEFDSITVSDNGAAAFGDASSVISSSNGNLPRSKPEYGIFPYWDDLKDAKVHYEQKSDRFIIQWSQAEHGDSPSGGDITFQVVLHKDTNNIDFVYNDVNFDSSGLSNGASATVGINKDNSTGIKYSLNESSLSDISSIRFLTEPKLLDSTITLSVNEGETVTLSQDNFKATDVDSDSNQIKFVVSNVQNGEFQLNDETVTEFSQADINADRVQFVHNGTENAPAFEVKITDGFNSTEIELVDINSGITFENINDSPELSLSNNAAFNENSLNQSAEKIYSNVNLSDVDSPEFDGGNLTVTYQSGGGEQDRLAIDNSDIINVDNNSVSFNGNVIGNISATDNGEDGNDLLINFTSDNATIDAVKAVIQNLTYQNTADTPSPSRTISVTVNDGGSDNDNTKKDSSAVTTEIEVTANNDSPVNVLPSAEVVLEEDVPLAFIGGNQISIGDVDANDKKVQVSLTATKGTLNINDITGLNFNGSNEQVSSIESSVLQFTGTIADINNALKSMSFAPDLNFNDNLEGSASVEIKTDDLGNIGTGGNLVDADAIDLKVNAINDTPVNTVPESIETDEDVERIITDLSIQDIDVNEGDGNLKVTLAVNEGSLTLQNATQITFAEGNDNDGNAAITFAGSLNQINTALAAGVIYKGSQNYNGSDKLTITTNDLGNTGSGGVKEDIDTVDLTVNAVNDAPLNTVPDAQEVDEDTQLVFNTENDNQIKIGDRDFNPQINQQPFTDEVEVSASVKRGTIQLGSTANLEVANDDSATPHN